VGSKPYATHSMDGSTSRRSVRGVSSIMSSATAVAGQPRFNPSRRATTLWTPSAATTSGAEKRRPSLVNNPWLRMAAVLVLGVAIGRFSIQAKPTAPAPTMATRSVPLEWRMELVQLVNGNATIAVAPIAARNTSRRVDCHVAATCSTHSWVGRL